MDEIFVSVHPSFCVAATSVQHNSFGDRAKSGELLDSPVHPKQPPLALLFSLVWRKRTESVQKDGE